MQIKIYHQTEYGQQFFEFVPGNKLKEVWDGETSGFPFYVEDSEVGDGFLNDVFAIFNADNRPDGKYQRSLSVGDVIQLGNFYFAVEMLGFRHVPVWDVFKT